MQTTMLWTSGVFSTRHHVLALPADVPERGDGRAAVGEQPAAVVRVGPRPGDDARAVVRADPRLVGLDQQVERRRIDVALLGEDALERADPQLRVGQLRALVAVVRVRLGHAQRPPRSCRTARTTRRTWSMTSFGRVNMT